MAQKTDSYLVPYAITGEYKFRSKDLTIKIGKPFKIDKMELEDANKKLFNEIKNLIDKNLTTSVIVFFESATILFCVFPEFSKFDTCI